MNLKCQYFRICILLTKILTVLKGNPAWQRVNFFYTHVVEYLLNGASAAVWRAASRHCTMMFLNSTWVAVKKAYQDEDDLWSNVREFIDGLDPVVKVKQ